MGWVPIARNSLPRRLFTKSEFRSRKVSAYLDHDGGIFLTVSCSFASSHRSQDLQKLMINSPIDVRV